MKRIALLGMGTLVGGLVLGLLVFLAVNRRAVSPASEPPPQVMATVNGEAITRDMVEAEMTISRLNVLSPSPPLTGEDLTRATKEALNQLIIRHLILQAAARQNFTLDEAFIQSRVDSLFGIYGDEALDEALRQAGATRADLFWWVSEITTVEEFVVQVVMDDADPEARHQVYNDWLNAQQAAADIQIYSNGVAASFTATVGRPAPDFTLTTLQGRAVSLSDYSGRVVLVYFWATWCPSCTTEMPAYQQAYERYGPPTGDFVVLGINLQEDPEQIQRFVDGLGITFPILLDKDGTVTGEGYQVTGMPASVIVDRQGVIFYRHIGPMSGEVLIEKLGELWTHFTSVPAGPQASSSGWAKTANKDRLSINVSLRQPPQRTD